VTPDIAGSELAARATAIYLPLVCVVALVIYRRPGRRLVGAALVAVTWNLVALLALNVIATRVGWWSFTSETASIADVPADL
jgi:uncharacterized membrane protein YwaF